MLDAFQKEMHAKLMAHYEELLAFESEQDAGPDVWVVKTPAGFYCGVRNSDRFVLQGHLAKAMQFSSEYKAFAVANQIIRNEGCPASVAMTVSDAIALEKEEFASVLKLFSDVEALPVSAE